MPVCVRPFICKVAGIVNTCLCANECLEWVCICTCLCPSMHVCNCRGHNMCECESVWTLCVPVCVHPCVCGGVGGRQHVLVYE